MEKKSLIEKKGFACFALLFGIWGLLIMAHHIVSYEAILRPFMDYLIENKVITNDIDGVTFLRMFTNESNILFLEKCCTPEKNVIGFCLKWVLVAKSKRRQKPSRWKKALFPLKI